MKRERIAVLSEPPKLNNARINRHKVDYVVFLRSVLHEYAKVHRTPESLRAVEEIEAKLNTALGAASFSV